MRPVYVCIAAIGWFISSACRGDPPGKRVGLLAPSADSLVGRVRNWSCGASKRTQAEGLLRYCVAQRGDTLLYFAVDSAERVILTGNQFAVTTQDLRVIFDSRTSSQLGVGQQCPTGLKNSQDRRWGAGESHLVLYASAPEAEPTYRPFVRIVRHIGPVRCGDIYSPVLGY